MKKLLCLVFVLIVVLGLAFAVSAAEAQKITGLTDGGTKNDCIETYTPDGNVSENGSGGYNGGSYDVHAFDGSYDAIYNNGDGEYTIADLNKKLPGGYYVTDIAITHKGGTKYSLYYKFGNGEWIAVAENTKTKGTYTYAINDYATQVKYVFVEAPDWNPQLCEIEIYGIDPAKMSCTHPNLSTAPWVEIEGTATCTDFGWQKQNCPDCGQEFTRQTSEVPALGHDIVTTITRPGTNISYGAATLKCSRCDYTIDFSGEVNLTDGTYSSCGESQQFVNILASSIADLWNSSSLENLVTGDWENIGPFHTWIAQNEVDEDEYVLLKFQGAIDLTKISVLVQNDNQGTLVLSALNDETGEYEVVRTLPTYDESKGAALRLDIPLLGVTTSCLKIQVFSNWRNTNGYYYNRMVIGEIEAFGIAKGCGLDADNHECVYDTFDSFEVAPTCQTAGTAKYKCACNATTTVEVAASEEYHNYVEVEGTRVDSTCTVAGSYKGKCEYCEAETTITLDFDTENGHDFSEEVSKTDADCENAGEIVYGCANCDATKTEEIKATGHNYQETSRTDADCENPGEIVSTCANCGGEKKEEIAVKGHTYVLNEDEIETEPTCGDAGFGAYYCSVCGDTKDDVIPPTGKHTWNEDYDELLVAPSCEGTGAAQFSCVDCSATERRVINALGHDFSVEVEGSRVDATCTTDGSYQANCANGCGKSQTKTITAEGHKKVPATCTAYESCENCDYVNTEAGYADHTWGTVACTAGNCVVCGAENPDANAVAHTYDWKIGGCPTCGTVAVPDVEGGKVSTNLGFSVFFAANWSEINANVSASSTYKVIKLTADTTVPSGNNYAKVQNANIYIDLGGHSITSSVGLAPLYLYAADALVNGTIIHNYGRQALYVCNVNLIENIDIVLGGTYANNVTGIYLAYNASYAAGFEKSTGSYIGSMKNVTIDSKRDENGNYIDNIGLFNHGLEFSNANSVIGNLENVKVYSRGQAITIMAKEIGTMTNCVFDGTNIGLNIGNLQCNINLVNCVVSSETLAVRIGGASSNELSFNFDANTKISSDGSVYYIPDNIKAYEGFESLTTAAALVNGQLYKTLDEAIAALNASTEEVTSFTLIGDLTIDAPIEINKTVKFSYGGGTFKIPTTGDKTFTEVTADGYTVTAPNGAFVVVEGGNLTLEGDGTLVGNENAVVVNGGTALIKAGTYVGFNPANFVADGACAAKNEETNSYTIAKEHDYDDYALSDKVTYNVDGVCNGCGYVRGVAAVDYVYYPTLEEAIAEAVRTGNVVVLADNVDLADTLNIDVQVTINLNGLKLSASKGKSGNGVLRVVEGGNLTIGNGTVDGVCSDPAGYHMAIWVDVGGIATINNGTFTNVGATGGNNADQYDLIYVKGGTLTIKNGTFICETPKWTLNVNDDLGGTISVSGGKFFGFNPQKSESENPVANFTSGKCAELDDEGYYVVKNHSSAVLEAKDPTCVETGLKEGSYCPVCNEILVPQEEVPVIEHNYVPVENEDGSTTYTCQNGCKDSYVINNAAVNGEYFLGTDRVVFNNGVLSAMGGEFTYTYNVTTGMIDTDAGIFFQVVEGTIYFRSMQPLHTHAVENLNKEVTDPTCTDKGYTTYICNTCGPLYTADEVDALGHTEQTIPAVPATCTTAGSTAGVKCSVCETVLTAPDTVDALGHTAGEEVIENNKPATPTEAGSYDKVVYCVTCNTVLSRETVTVEPTCKHETTEIIPAELPLPSNNHIGKTEGSYCLDCETVVKEQVEFTAEKLASDDEYRFRSITLTLDENISINYHVPGTYKNVYAVFKLLGNEYIVDTHSDHPTNGRFIFNFNKLNPNLMGENIEAYVYAETEDGYVRNEYLEYSILQYCVSQIKKASSTPEYKTLISNILALGAATQMYTGHNTDKLVTKLAEEQGCTLTPTTFTSVPEKYNISPVVTGNRDANTDWKSALLVLGAATQIQFKFVSNDIEGLVIKVNVAGTEYSYNANELDVDDTGKYVVTVDCLTSVQYDVPVTATFERNGVAFGGTATYSINAHIYKKHETASDANERNLLKVLYEYGSYVKSYYGY